MNVEIEVKNDRNCDLYFFPLRRRIRGAFDQDKSLDGKPERELIGKAIPGQVIGVSKDACHVREPLRLHEHSRLREYVQKRNFQIPQEREEFSGSNREEWLYWMRRAVEGGHAVLVTGKFPEVIDYSPPFDCMAPKPKSMEEQVAERLRTDIDFAVRWTALTEKQRSEILKSELKVS